MSKGNNELDLNNDNIVSDDEIKVKETEMLIRRQTAQRRMATTALVCMILFTIILLTPIIPDARIKLLGSISDLFYISMASIVGAYMGITAYMSRR